MQSSRFSRSVSLAILTAVAVAANAADVYRLDDLQIVRTNATDPSYSFLDTFESAVSVSGALYFGGTYTFQSGATSPGSYIMGAGQAPAPKVSGAMQLRRTDGTSTVFEGVQYDVLHYYLNQNISNSNTADGLKLSSSFTVAARYFFDAPSNGGYRLRLTDLGTTQSAYNDTIELLVQNTSSGVRVRLAKIFFAPDSDQLIDQSESISSYLGAATWIELSYLHVAGDLFVTPAIKLIGVGGSVLYAENLSPASLFNGEQFTRVDVSSVWSTPVPEPGSRTLMAAGFLLVAALRKRLFIRSAG